MEKTVMSQLSVISIVRDVLREWVTVLLLAVSVCLFANIWVTARYEPVYTTTATFAVTAKGTGNNVYQNLSSAQNLAGQFTQILDSNVLKKQVMEDLELDSFDAKTSATQIEETNLVELRVSASSGLDAYRILKSIMENYNSVSDYVIGGVILEEVQAPAIPSVPTNSVNVRKVMVRGFLIGAAAAICFLAFLSYKRDTIKNETQLSEKVDAKRLGTIYHEKKSDKLFEKAKNLTGVSMLIQNPLRSFWFVESNRMTASRVRSRMESKGIKTVMVTSVMENEGKSTVVSNLALALAQEVNKVLLIDCDFRKPSLHKIFELDEECVPDLPAALRKKNGYEKLVCRYGDTNLYLAANREADSSEAILEDGGLERLIDAYRDEMDYIILDTAPMALVSETEDMARLVDASILIVREDAVLARNINDAIDALNRTEGKVLGCIFNNAHRGIIRSAGGYGYSRYGGYYGKSAE